MSATVPASTPARSLADLRKSYHEHLQAHRGRLEDPALGQALIHALEEELGRASVQLDRTGTVYHMPKVPKPGKA